MIDRLLARLAANGMPVLAIGIFLGLAWPALATRAAPLLVPSVFLILTAAALRVDWQAVARMARRPGPSLLLVAWAMVLTPLLAKGVMTLTPVPPALVTAVVLMAAAPPIMSSVAFAVLLDLDTALAVIPTFGATLATPLLLPPVALALIGLEIRIDAVEFMARLGGLIGGAFILAAFIRRAVGPAALAARASRIDGAAVVLLLVFAVAIMDGVTGALVARPRYVGLVLAVAFLANLGLQATGGLAFAWLGRRQALTAAFLSGNRNMALLLAALAGAADFDVVLYFAVAQIPMYVLPAILAPAYRRLLRE